MPAFAVVGAQRSRGHRAAAAACLARPRPDPHGPAKRGAGSENV